MKLLNIFKKKNSKIVKSTIQKIDKHQQAKIIGGATSWEPHKMPGLDLPEQQ